MLSYEVTATLDPLQGEEFERYMRERHIPDLLATGCFVAAAFARVAPGRYRMRYEAATPRDLDRYQADHAPRLRAEFSARYPGVSLEREILTVLERWAEQEEP
ncbi:MAG: DUF4286 family protein [Gemmatimonadales bacterium]